jgi:homoserine kinase type II
MSILQRPPITQEEIQAVLRYYDVGTLRTEPEPGGGTANSSLKITTEAGAFFLKRRNPRYSQESFVAFDHAFMEHMAPFRIGTPLAVKTREGKRWLRLNENVYELFPYQPGGPHNRHSPAQIAAAGRSLAAFHRAARLFVPPPGKEWPRYHSPQQVREGIEEMMPELKQRLSSEDLEYLIEQVTLIETGCTDEMYHSLPKLVVHGDYHPANIKFLNDSVSGIFDLDWATFQPRLLDVADGIIFFAGERASDLDSGNIYSLTQTWAPSVSRTALFMKAYLAEETLDTRELALLPIFIRTRWLHCRVNGRIKVAPEHRLEYFLADLLPPLRALDTIDALY